MDVLWIDPAVGPVEIGDAFDQPTLPGHFGEVGFDARVVVEGEVFDTALSVLHCDTSFLRL